MLPPIFDLDELKTMANSTMVDRCYIQDRTDGTGPTGQPLDPYVERATPVSCRFFWGGNSGGSTSLDEGPVRANVTQAGLFLPLGTDIGPEDKVRVTQVKGEAVDLLFSVDGIPLPGPTSLLVRLEQVTL